MLWLGLAFLVIALVGLSRGVAAAKRRGVWEAARTRSIGMAVLFAVAGLFCLALYFF